MWVIYLLDGELLSSHGVNLARYKGVVYWTIVQAVYILHCHETSGGTLCPTKRLLDAFAKLLKASISFVINVSLSAWNNSAPTGLIILKFRTLGVFEDLPLKFNLDENLTRITDTFHEYACTFIILSRWILRMINVSDKHYRKIKTRILCSMTFFENYVVCEIVWKKYCRAVTATL
jgi:hypothetical protein